MSDCRKTRGFFGGSQGRGVAMSTNFNGSASDTRSAAMSKMWANLPEQKITERTTNGLSKWCATLGEVDLDSSGNIGDVIDLTPVDRWKRVSAYEKRRSMREARGSSSSTCPLADAVAMTILNLYDAQPDLKYHDMAAAAAEKPVSVPTISTSICRRDAALARWESTTKEERVKATMPGLSAGKVAKANKAMEEYSNLAMKLADGTLTAAERITTVEKYKSRIARRKKTGIETCLCAELDSLASHLQQQYLDNPTLRLKDLKELRNQGTSK